jgi:predicted site-specific integrase-resolvase
MKVGIGRAAAVLGVSRDTLRRWEASGKIQVERTPSGHRRYDLAQLRGLTLPKSETERVTVAYARVASSRQKQELKNQIDILTNFCQENGWQFQVIQDIGTGVNYRKSGLRELIRRICQGDVNRLVLTHRDRLLRFGIELIFSLCEHFATEIVIVNASSLSEFEDEIAEDIMEIIAIFTARLYGSHNDKNRNIIKELMDVAKQLEA